VGFDVYSSLGVRKVVNAAATLTAIGGCTLPEEVVDAMSSAASSCVDVRELQQRAGEEIASLTNNEGAYVTSGCAAAIVLAVLACTTNGDPALIARLPYEEQIPRNVVMHRAHRIPYDRAVELAGGRIVEIGNMFQTFEWELAEAIDQHAAAVMWVAGTHLPQSAALDLAQTVEVAHAKGVPVVVDAAAQLPPAQNLWRFSTGIGADLVLFSGGKALRGPQSSGLMVGRRVLVEAAAANASPNQRLARALKVGKEEICGLLAAVRRFLGLDFEAALQGWEATVASWSASLAGLSGGKAQRAFPNEAGQPVPRLRLELDPAVAGVSADDVIGQLWDEDPRIAVLKGEGESIYLTPDTLSNDTEKEIVIAGVLRALRASREGPDVIST
jgi:D-glucosaminate-6-phosphate ammonia-lyase